jgi:hypothetical protein
LKTTVTVLPIAKVLRILGEALELLALPYKLPVENGHLPPIYRSRMPENTRMIKKTLF